MSDKNKLIDWTEHRFRASEVGNIMVGANIGLSEKQESLLQDYQARMSGEGKPLTDRQKGILGDLLKRKHERPRISGSAKSFLDQMWAEVTFGKRRILENKYLYKGVAVEEHSISLYSRVIGMPFFKNKERRKNEWLSGEPDNTYSGKIRDIKSSWDLSTFPFNETEITNKTYFWQLQSYMMLWEYEEAELIYCLVDTPEELINQERFNVARKTGYLDLPEFLEEEILNRMTFSDIPEAMRINVLPCKYDHEAVKAMLRRIEDAREYLMELNEKYAGKMIQFFEEKMQEA